MFVVVAGHLVSCFISLFSYSELFICSAICVNQCHTPSVVVPLLLCGPHPRCICCSAASPSCPRQITSVFAISRCAPPPVALNVSLIHILGLAPCIRAIVGHGTVLGDDLILFVA